MLLEKIKNIKIDSNIDSYINVFGNPVARIVLWQDEYKFTAMIIKNNQEWRIHSIHHSNASLCKGKKCLCSSWYKKEKELLRYLVKESFIRIELLMI